MIFDNWRGLGRVFRYELVRRISKRSFIFFAFGIPLIALIIYGAYNAYRTFDQSRAGATVRIATPAPITAATPSRSSPFGGSAQIGIVDQSNLLRVGALTFPLVRYDTVTAAGEALTAGKIGSYYLIPADYMKTGQIELWMSRFNLENTNSGAARAVLTRALTAQLGEVDPSVIRLLTTRSADITNTVVTETQSNRTASDGAQFAVVYAFAIVYVFGVFFSSGLLMQGVMEEKQSRIVEILIASVRPWQLLGGKILALGLLGLLQMIAWVGAAIFIIRGLVGAFPFLSDLVIPVEKLPLLILYYMLGYFMFAAIFAAVGAISNSTREGPQIAGVFTLPAMTPLYLIGVFVAQPDGALAVFLSLFPISAPIAMVMRTMTSVPVPVWQTVVSVILLVITDVALIWFAGRVFRFGIMLAGAPPRWRDLPRLLRG